MNEGKRKAKGQGRVSKIAVMGLLERHSEKGHSTVKTEIVPDISRSTLHRKVKERVEAGSEDTQMRYHRIED
jgi:hypothetical protein